MSVKLSYTDSGLLLDFTLLKAIHVDMNAILGSYS